MNEASAALRNGDCGIARTFFANMLQRLGLGLGLGLERESLHLDHRPVRFDQPHEPPLLPVLALACSG